MMEIQSIIEEIKSLKNFNNIYEPVLIYFVNYFAV
jgi:hypothetical protein